MKCMNCGKEIPETAKVCGFCGTKQIPPEPVAPAPVTKSREVATAPVEVEPTPKDAQGRKRAFPFWAIGVIVVAVIAVAYLVLRNPGGPTATSPEPGSQPAQPESFESVNPAPPTASSSEPGNQPAQSEPAEYALPEPVYQWIEDPRVEMYDSFTSLNTDFWEVSNAWPEDGALILEGTEDLSATLVSRRDFWKGDAVLFRMTISDRGTYVEGFYNDERYQTPNFKQFILYVDRDNRVVAGDREDGDVVELWQEFDPATILPGQWYDVLLMIEEDTLRWVVWPVDRPDQQTSCEERYPDEWESERFKFLLLTSLGKLEIDEAYWITFE